MARRIGVFTGSRSEYGLLLPVLRAIDAHSALELVLIEGMGRDPADAPEFRAAATVPVKRDDESAASTPRAIGRAVLGVTDALERLRPDALVIYGDRFEAFAAMIAATQMRVPTAHIEGGDLTQGGTLDDVVRHAMTKLAHIHFTTNAEAAGRVRMMGEEPWRIHDVGFPPIDLIRTGDFAPPGRVVEELGLDEARPLVLFTLHPISTSPDKAGEEIAACLDALERARTDLGAQLVLTHPNGDLGSAAIVAALEGVAGRDGVTLRRSLGRWLYHGVLNWCGRVGRGVCVGNSSSGLKETPAFACPAVDIGPRQDGRLRGENVLHVPCEADAIFGAIRTSLTDEAFRARVAAAENPYGKGDAGPSIARVLAGLDLGDPGLVAKRTVFPER
ncbi:UDP-N-acetylglucosamine 2-epimerase (hydrolyzing) [Silicimonas algicola]|uniref:UDP-N-acetylglucosamine 2-epimerase (Non-hydrolysing)/GDP/UDP-N,N'-diacetylbacillosamine 2-epimerase (Hydrolysing) n=1 Tax=Silicimonas algicola TaxID=1826607 RepID=A0A316G4E7_9RHOB|nr:UDP-N-acetylglucosamine 2-epimerase [Silicimonas algicola]AZQ67018.1 UDP-N-acetylglucosamine 2-epimerase (hydrolyzing) [Silicimonas algicola]PWK55462.1 UDP-N-acetylglucosamine 2-epimerase (non-hydrolysing)/GDP/UDP-N,N'-diacetylbacillosamine 2-epimerase (hydrolysing) [Silicimonas algicola]